MKILFASLVLFFVCAFTAHACDSFSPYDPNCTGTQSAVNPYAPYAGQWFNPEFSGQGFFLEVADEQAEFALYTYGVNGTQAWLLSESQSAHGPVKTALNLYRPHGGRFLQAGYVDVGTPVGTLTFTPTDCEHAVVSVYFGAEGYLGCSGFSPPNPVCSQSFNVVRLTHVSTCSQ
jgi:hypothetical protein